MKTIDELNLLEKLLVDTLFNRGYDKGEEQI